MLVLTRELRLLFEESHLLLINLFRLAAGKYGRATILPVVMVSASVLGSAIGTFLFYKYSRYLKERRN